MEHGMGKLHESQTGVAIHGVLVVILITSLLVIFTARTALFHEVLTGNDNDYQKTYEAAKILMQDAELDVRGLQSSGASCQSSASSGATDTCRSSSPVFFPQDREEMAKLLSYLDGLPHGCSYGICRKRMGIQDFWSDPQILLPMTAENVGARYGQFTGASSASGGNPILAMRGTASRANDLKGAWYWVEVLPFVETQARLLSQNENNAAFKSYAPDPSRPWIYRITVLARGNKKSTEVVLQSIISLQAIE